MAVLTGHSVISSCLHKSSVQVGKYMHSQKKGGEILYRVFVVALHGTSKVTNLDGCLNVQANNVVKTNRAMSFENL